MCLGQEPNGFCFGGGGGTAGQGSRLPLTPAGSSRPCGCKPLGREGKGRSGQALPEGSDCLSVGLTFGLFQVSFGVDCPTPWLTVLGPALWLSCLSWRLRAGGLLGGGATPRKLSGGLQGPLVAGLEGCLWVDHAAFR